MANNYLISFIILVTIFNCHILNAKDIRLPTDSSETEEQPFLDVITNSGTAKDVQLPFPVYIVDPYEFKSIEFNLPGEIFSIYMNISDGSISGLSAFRLLDLALSNTEPKIGFNVLFPTLIFHAEHYELGGNIYHVVPLKGRGVAHLEITNLQFWGILYLKNTEIGNSIIFDKLEDADFSIGKIVSLTEIDNNIDKIISAMIEDLLADYLNRFSKYITTTYSDTLIQYINDIVLMLENN